MKQLNWYQIFGNVHIIPEGSTVTPTDDVQILLHCANIWDKSYTTLAEVLADDDTLFLICISDNAIDYLVRSTTWASNAALAPTMTSNTTPSGVVSASSVYENRPQDQPYHAFDGSDSAAWSPATGRSSNYLQYKFDESHIFSAFSIKTSNRYTDEARIDTLTVSIGETEETLTTVYSYNPNQTVIDKSDSFTPTSGKVCRVTFYQSQGYKYCSVPFLQFYSEGIVSSESAMEYIGASDYASETLLSDSTWAEAIISSAYVDYVANVQNPNMTSNTAPSGQCIGNSTYSGYEWYKAFDGNDATYGIAASSATTGSGHYLGYLFPNNVNISCVHVHLDGTNTTYKLQDSSDGETWNDASVNVVTEDNHTFLLSGSHKGVRAYKVSSSTTRNFAIYEMDIYGRENAGVQSWLKAGGVEGKKYTTVSEVLSDLTTLATLMSSSDAIDYLVTAKGWATEICSDSNAMADIGMNNYAANTLLADETWAEAIGNSAYIDSVMNVKVPVMTDNTHPYGECISSGATSSEQNYKAFDNDGNTLFSSSGQGTGAGLYLGFIFPAGAKIRIAKATHRANISSAVTMNFVYQASKDGGTWRDVSSNSNVTINNDMPTTVTLLSSESDDRGYRLYKNSSTSSIRLGMWTLQFYGRKDI